jgi:hypothetical protein
MTPDLQTQIRSDELTRKRAKEIAEASQIITDGFRVWDGFELGLLRRRPFLEVPELHDYLTDAADWNADTWDFEPEGRARLARTLGWLYGSCPSPFCSVRHGAPPRSMNGTWIAQSCSPSLTATPSQPARCTRCAPLRLRPFSSRKQKWLATLLKLGKSCHRLREPLHRLLSGHSVADAVGLEPKILLRVVVGQVGLGSTLSEKASYLADISVVFVDRLGNAINANRVPPQHEQIAQFTAALLLPPAVPPTELNRHASQLPRELLQNASSRVSSRSGSGARASVVRGVPASRTAETDTWLVGR